jgi:hypothetical protein
MVDVADMTMRGIDLMTYSQWRKPAVQQILIQIPVRENACMTPMDKDLQSLHEKNESRAP